MLEKVGPFAVDRHALTARVSLRRCTHAWRRAGPRTCEKSKTTQAQKHPAICSAGGHGSRFSTPLTPSTLPSELILHVLSRQAIEAWHSAQILCPRSLRRPHAGRSRWLRADKDSVKNAEKRLRAHAKWRAEYVPAGRIEEVPPVWILAEFQEHHSDSLSTSNNAAVIQAVLFTRWHQDGLHMLLLSRHSLFSCR